MDPTLADAVDHPEQPTWTRIDPALADAVYERLLRNINKQIPNPQIEIPLRPYCQGSALPGGGVGQVIMFATLDDKCLPAAHAFAGQCGSLVDGDEVVPTAKKTISLRIEWPGYSGWEGQIRTMNYQKEPKGITRSKLLKEVAKQLEKFIQNKRTDTIDPAYAKYRVGPGGIELGHIYIASLEQVSGGSWQPRLMYSGL